VPSRTQSTIQFLAFPLTVAAAATGRFGFRLWDVETDKPLPQLPVREETEYRSANLSTDANWLLTVSLENRCEVWNVQSGRSRGRPFNRVGHCVWRQ